MTARILVLTTVHHPDDTRIREKSLRALSAEFDVVYAAREPGPADPSGVEPVVLAGGRFRRNLAAWRVAWTASYDIIAAHDPELLPLLLLVSRFRRVAAVFDVHEDIPAQILTKHYLPRPLRRPLASLASWLLARAEATIVLTLAEEGYRRRFRHDHPVIPNHPVTAGLPEPSIERSGEVCYVGDVTVERGVADAVEAAGRAGVPLRVVGPVSGATAADLERLAVRYGAVVEMMGRQPHAAAMGVLARASVAVSPLHALPNYLESVPTKVLEYLAMGVPVVATDLPATRRVVEGLEAVELVPPSHPTEMAEAIGRAMKPESLAAALRQVPLVRARFSWDPAGLVSVYRDALAGRASSG